MIPNVHLMKDDDGPFADLERHKKFVGKLNYLTVTRRNVDFVMLTELDRKVIEDLLQAIVSLLEGTLYSGEVRRKVFYCYAVQNPSTELCHSLCMRLCGYVIFQLKFG